MIRSIKKSDELEKIAASSLSSNPPNEDYKVLFLNHLKFTIIKDQNVASNKDKFFALAYAVKDQMIYNHLLTEQSRNKNNFKEISYISFEFSLGKSLILNLCNLGLQNKYEEALNSLELHLNDLKAEEKDAGLGEGCLGSVSDSYMESLSTLKLPAYGYGIRYEHGSFLQSIRNCEQKESPDNWLKYGNPWEKERPANRKEINFFGRVINNSNNYKWIDTQVVNAVPFDYLIQGHKNKYVNILRLFSAKVSSDTAFQSLRDESIPDDLNNTIIAEILTKKIYPPDNIFPGKMIKLQQEYFLVAATLQDIIERYKKSKFLSREANRITFEQFPEKVAIQLNETHPSLAIPELMRILVDIEHLSWEDAWHITVQTFAYTNYTRLSEALERWPVTLLGNLLPRHLQIIYEINDRFLREVENRWPGDTERIRRMSMIDDGSERMINMAHLSIVGSHAVNGVSAVHSEILKKEIFKDFYEMTPEKFLNISNGITPRRWLLLANPGLADVISRKIGNTWIKHLDELQQLKQFSNDGNFLKDIDKVKEQNKIKLAKHIQQLYNIQIDLKSIFDIHMKQIHEDKRQVLTCLHIITMYNRIKKNPDAPFVPRSVIMGGKAPPDNLIANDIIKLINSIASTVNHDPIIQNKLKIVFLENYRVSLEELVIPAADLTEQISLAGTETPDVDNIKFMMNGAITIGTLDGSNIDMKAEIGMDNMFIFGMCSENIKHLKAQGYHPWDYYNKLPELKVAIDQITNGFFFPQDPNIFRRLIDTLMNHDKFFTLADYETYIQSQERVSHLYTSKKHWLQMSLMNIASSGKFSSDRAITEYASQIWEVSVNHESLPIPNPQPETKPT